MISPQLLHDNIRYFDLLKTHCRSALARGLPAELAASLDVAALIGLSYENATPSNEHWADVSPWYHGEGHAEHIYLRLA